MPTWTKLVVGWAIAAIIAIAFSWGAVSQVRNRVIQPSVEIPTTEALAATPTQPSQATTTSAPIVIRVEPEVVDAATTTGELGTGSVTTQTTATAEETSTSSTNPPATTSTTSTTTTTQPPTTTTTQPPTTSTTTTTLPPQTTTTTSPPQTETSTHTLTGGVVTISHSLGVVNFVSAIPQSGFSTEQRETGPNEVRIRFESEDHTSDFRAKWEGDQLEITKNETGES